jgi:hypothetical protein
MVFLKAPASENSVLRLSLIIGSLAVIVVTLILWPAMAMIGWHCGRPLGLTPQQRRVRLLVRVACLLIVVFFAALETFFTLAEKDIGLLSPHGNPWLRFVEIVVWLEILGTASGLYNAWGTWQESQRWMFALICRHATSLALCGCSLIWVHSEPVALESQILRPDVFGCARAPQQ